MTVYVYLHGFASSPRSRKAQDLRDRFAALNLKLHTPDLNQNDFTHLTLTRQIQQVCDGFPLGQPIVIIGSSLGGLTAAWVGEHCSQVDRLVLLAPAFEFLTHWLPKLGDKLLHEWQSGTPLMVYHYGAERLLPLSYQFVVDCAGYDLARLRKPIPTLILHGISDQVIPIQVSRDYVCVRPWVELVELDSDHA
ncbi:MAG: alpha/beta fold hydrolase, partial [Phormidesmis sp. CAN_BIN36]|nr:alpha/beta fold hydrolase [Phormidesmis sp. CAN_BIN36]